MKQWVILKAKVFYYFLRGVISVNAILQETSEFIVTTEGDLLIEE